MTAKEYLELLPDMQLRINAIGRQIKACDDRAKDISLRLCESAGSSGRGKIEGNIEDKVDYEAELRKLKKEFEDFVLKAEKAISEFERIIPEGTRLSPCIPLPDMI